jgi:hypothetical protein
LTISSAHEHHDGRGERDRQRPQVRLRDEQAPDPMQHEPELVQMRLRRRDVAVTEVVRRAEHLPRNRRQPHAEGRHGEGRETVALAAYEYGCE